VSFHTVDFDGTPWLVCEAPNSTEPREVARKCGLDLAKVKVRTASSSESAILQLDRLLAAKEGRDPHKIFGVRL
jgi:hypothetical protein